VAHPTRQNKKIWPCHGADSLSEVALLVAETSGWKTVNGLPSRSDVAASESFILMRFRLLVAFFDSPFFDSALDSRHEICSFCWKLESVVA
jgi:hypothetical protein